MTSNKIYSHSARQYWQIWLIALVWNASIGITIVKGGQNILNAFAANPILYLFILLPFVGLWFIFDALRRTLAWHKFGKVPIILSPSPGLIGGTCSGYMTLPPLASNAQQAEISLSCIRRYVSSKNNGKRRHYSKLIWQDRMPFKAEKYDQEMRLNFAFSTPDELPETGQRCDDYHIWNIHIHVPLSGIDFDRNYEVPMKKVQE